MSRRAARRGWRADTDPHRSSRRPAHPAALLVDAGDRHRHRHVGARRGGRQHRAAGDRRRVPRQPGRIDLGRQRLSARRGDGAAAARLARRARRLSPRLSLGPGDLHPRLGRLRAVAEHADADRGAGRAGRRRRRRVRGQRRAGALHLSARPCSAAASASTPSSSRVASAVGPSVAAAILAVGPWQWLFAINAPFGIVNLVVGYRALPHSDRGGRPFDLVSATLNALAFGLFFVGADAVTHGEGTMALAVAEVVAACRRARRRWSGASRSSTRR